MFLKQTWKSLGLLCLPVVVLGGIYSGIFTPTEASVVAVVYSLVLGIVYRDLTLKSFLTVCQRTLFASGALIFIIAISQLFGFILSVTKIPQAIATAILPYVNSPALYIVFLMVILLIIGAIMEITPAVIILAPILVPIGVELGLDPLHIGVIYCINLTIGLMTPPFGMCIFTAITVLGGQYQQIVKYVWPSIIVAVILLFVFAFVPEIVIFLPRLALK
jgi:C4-dicarboxylate transporter DctM subunit